jgi:quinol monooxygenase YgiN
MPYVLVRQKTRDQERWRLAFDSQRTRRREAGCRSELVLINDQDPNDLFALMEFEDAEALRKYVGGEHLQKALAEARVISNEHYVLHAANSEPGDT